MPSNKPIIAIRTTDTIKTKIEHIAEVNNRSVSKEVELLIKRHINRFEDEHGEIRIDDEPQEEPKKYPLKLPYTNRNKK